MFRTSGAVFFILLSLFFLISCIGNSPDAMFGANKKINSSSQQIECPTKIFDGNKKAILLIDTTSTNQSTIICEEDRINPCFPKFFRWINSGEIGSQKSNFQNEIMTLKFFSFSVQMAKINYECY